MLSLMALSLTLSLETSEGPVVRDKLLLVAPNTPEMLTGAACYLLN